MRMIRLIALLLGSLWFLPAGCVLGMMAAPTVLSMADARDVARGDELHDLFKVVVGGDTAKSMDEVASLLARLKETGGGLPPDSPAMQNLFMVPEASGRFESDASIFTYSVLHDSGDAQLIELKEEYRDGDNTIWSRYRARPDSVEPISSRMYYFGYVFMAIPYVFGGTLALFFIGRLVLSRIGKSPEPGGTS